MAEEDTMVQDMMSMMFVVMGIAIIGQVLQAQAAPAEPGVPNRSVTITLRNPPAGATVWQLVLCDWDITVAIEQVGGLALVDVAEPITFEIPSGVTFPLRVISLQASKWNEDETALIVLYEMQSFRPYLWDFDEMKWSDEPDPGYKEAFLNAFGSSYYDVQLEAFTSW